MGDRFICDMRSSHIRFDVNSGLHRDLLSDRILAPRSSMNLADEQNPVAFMKEQKHRVFWLFLQTRYAS